MSPCPQRSLVNTIVNIIVAGEASIRLEVRLICEALTKFEWVVISHGVEFGSRGTFTPYIAWGKGIKTGFKLIVHDRTVKFRSWSETNYPVTVRVAECSSQYGGRSSSTFLRRSLEFQGIGSMVQVLRVW